MAITNQRAVIQAKQNIAAVARAGKTAAHGAVVVVGIDLKKELVAILEQKDFKYSNRRGRVYTRRGVTWQASAPGEPPAYGPGPPRSPSEDIGPHYADTIEESTVTSGDTTIVSVGTSDPRGPGFEFGFGRVAARPHFAIVAERYRGGQVTTAVATAMSKAEVARVAALGATQRAV